MEYVFTLKFQLSDNDADLLVWLKARGYRFPASLLELAVVTRQVNAVRELEALGLLEVETDSPAGIGLVLRQACIDGLARGQRSSGSWLAR